MRFLISIGCDNDSLNTPEKRRYELSQILHTLAATVCTNDDESEILIRDVNGNRVGYAIYLEE
jgi:hypothetical protein